MSELPDLDRIHELLNRLERTQRESESIRAQLERREGECEPWPDRRRRSRLFEDARPVQTDAAADV